MSEVPKRKRMKSRFEVLNNYYVMRREITDYLLRDFAYSEEKAEKNLFRKLGIKTLEEANENQLKQYEILKQKEEAFAQWFIPDERQKIIKYMSDLGMALHMANSIIPQYMKELIERRTIQGKALGYIAGLENEIQYAVETLPTDLNKINPYLDRIEREIDLIKGWRKSDNRFKKTVIDHELCFPKESSKEGEDQKGNTEDNS